MRKSSYSFLAIALLVSNVALTINSSAAISALQKRSEGVKETAGPKRSTGVREEQSVTGQDRDLKRIVGISSYNQREGALVLVAVPGARVALASIRGNRVEKPDIFQLKGQNNTLALSKLKPGTYHLSITHPDYRPREETITIKEGEIKPLTDLLIPKYGGIVIGGVPSGAKLSLDGKSSDLAQLSADGKIMISRLLEGEHEITISKDGYDHWSKKIRVMPGEVTPETAELRLATITLIVKSIPGAHVYLNNAVRGAIQPNGALKVENTLPGTYRLRITLDGFEDAEQSLALTLNDRQPVAIVDLAPIPESAEASEEFLTGASKWIVPRTWSLNQHGLLIKGDEVGLFKDPTEKRPFNIYGDFDLDFDLRFNNGRGAAWIARAKDDRNYYLFELVANAIAGGQPRFNFYLCRDGKCELKDSRRVVEKLDTANDSFHIKLQARGSRFSHQIAIFSTPRPDDPQPLGIFEDSTLSRGGIGFRGLNGSEVLLQSLVVRPVNKTNARSDR